MVIIAVTYIAPNHPHLEFRLLTLLRTQIKSRLEKTVNPAPPIWALCHLARTKFRPMVLEESKLNLATDLCIRCGRNIMCGYVVTT
jgi:hypothetical protein